MKLATETDLKRQVVQALRKAGWKVYVTSERRRGYSKMPTGLPDLFIRHVARKLHGWLEVKRPGEKLRPEQIRFQREAWDAGESHWVCEGLWNLPGLVPTESLTSKWPEHL